MLNNNEDYVREIITNAQTLSERSLEVDVKKDNDEVRQIVLELKDTLRAHKNGVGLAAPQIGKNKRIFVINFNGDIRTFINPIITQVKGMALNREGCLSLPGKEYIIPRFNEINVMYQTPLAKIEERKFLGLAAYIFQHELDHLEGIILSDMGLEVDSEFDNATEEEKAQILHRHLESLDLKKKDLDKEIEENPELKKTKDAIDFMTKVQKGEVKVEFEKVDEETSKKIDEKLKSSINDDK